MTLGITGASGQLGTAVVRYLAARVEPTRIVAITRTPEKLEAFARQGIDVRAGDFDAPSALQEAFAGVERLLVIPTSAGVRERQHAAAIHAAVAAGVRHVIYVSSVGARPGPLGDIQATHFATEQALFAAPVRWTVLRMGPYTDYLLDPARRGLDSGTYAAVGGAPAAYVTRDDVAVAAAGLLAANGHEGATYHATGPESVTHAQILSTLSLIAGRPVAWAPLTLQQFEAGAVAAGLPAAVASVLARFQAALGDGAFDLVTGDVERLGGRRAEPVADFLTRSLRAALAQASA